MGPLLVTAHIGEVAYCLDLEARFIRVYPVFHVSLLRRFVVGSNGIEPPEPIEVEDTWEYVMERLLAHRHGCLGNWQLLVQWEGYDASEDTWIYEDDLSGA